MFRDHLLLNVTRRRNEYLSKSSVTAPDTSNDAARASEWVYQAPEAREANQGAFGLQGYTLDPRFNETRFAVLHHKASNQTLLVHRGTDTSNARDLATDGTIVGNTFAKSVHYQEALGRSQDAMAANPGRQFMVTGHSLGGTTAHYVGNKLGLESHAFNPGHGVMGAWHGIEHNGGTHHIYVTRGDWISEGSVHERNRAEVQMHVNDQVKSAKNAHSVYNWMQGTPPLVLDQ